MMIINIDTVYCPYCDWEFTPEKSHSWIFNDELKAQCDKCRKPFIINPCWSVVFSCYPQENQLKV